MGRAMALPQDLKYSETHEWIRIIEKKDPKNKKAKPELIGIIGITGYAVSRLSDLVHIDLPNAGDNIEQGHAFGEVESVKTVAELVSPVTGKVIDVNKEAIKHVDLVMEEPYEDGWLIKVKLNDKTEAETLMSDKEYEEYIKTANEEEEKEDEEEDEEEEEIDEGFFM